MKYYRGFPTLPIFATPKKGHSKEQIVRIPQFDSRYLCTDHPTLVQNNTAFVIDLSYLKSKGDVRADDMGAWKCTGSRTLKFNIAVDETECHILSNESEQCSVVKASISCTWN